MEERADLAEVKVFRFDPVEDKEPRYEVYRVPYKGYTVLNVLRYIMENHDPTLSFRFGCAGGGYQRCGCCPVLVNRTPVLSCKKVAEKEMVIEPHPKFEVIKDLAIDLERRKEKWPDTKVEVEIEIDPDRCDGCRDCLSICPVGVYEIRKLGESVRAYPVDLKSCCGMSCRQCVIFCKNSAITIKKI